MHPELLAALTSKDQQDYKNVKPVIAAIGHNDKEAIKSAVTVLRALLAGNEHKVHTKLNALRFLRDCYQTGNKRFIRATEQYLLPFLKAIARDSLRQQAFDSYAERAYVEKEDIVNFKSYLMSMFTLCVECIKNWEDWHKAVEPNTVNVFGQLRKDLSAEGVKFPLSDQYFKPANKAQFVQNYQTANKSGNASNSKILVPPPESRPPPLQQTHPDERDVSKTFPLPPPPSNDQKKSQKPLRPETLESRMEPSGVSPYHQKLVAIMARIRQVVNDSSKISSLKEDFEKLDEALNEAFDSYANNQKNFDDEFITQMYAERDQLHDGMVRKLAQKKRPLQPPPNPQQRFEVSDSRSQQQRMEEPTPNPPPKSAIGGQSRSKFASADSPPSMFDQAARMSEDSVQRRATTEKYATYNRQAELSEQPRSQSLRPTSQVPVTEAPNIRVIEPIPLSTQRSAVHEQYQTNPTNRITFGVPSKPESFVKEKIDPAVEKRLLEQIQQLTQERNSKKLIADNISKRLESSNVKKLRQELRGETVDIERLSDQVENLEKLLNRQKSQAMEVSVIEPATNAIIEERPLTFMKPKGQPAAVYSPITNAQEFTIELEGREFRLFKLCVLGKCSQLCPQAPFNVQLVSCQLQSHQNRQQYCHVQLSSDGENIELLIDNSSSYAVWKKPSAYSSAEGRSFHEIAVALEDIPMSYVRCTLTNSSRLTKHFYLPLAFINFLRPGNVQPRDFQKAFLTNESKVVHSKVLKLNEQLTGGVDELQTLLSMDLLRIRNQQCLCGTYLYQPLDVLLLAVVELLNNQRVVIRVLELNKSSGSKYAKELLRNLTFLLVK